MNVTQNLQTFPLAPDKLVILLRLALAFDRDGGHRIVGSIRRQIQETHAQTPQRRYGPGQVDLPKVRFHRPAFSAASRLTNEAGGITAYEQFWQRLYNGD